MTEPMTPERRALLRNLDLGDSPEHVRSAYKALLAEVDRLNGELAKASQFPANEDGQRFKPGKTYRTANGLYTFKCNYIAGGYALGIQRYDEPGHSYHRTWYAVMSEGCWTELAAEESAR